MYQLLLLWHVHGTNGSVLNYTEIEDITERLSTEYLYEKIQFYEDAKIGELMPEWKNNEKVSKVVLHQVTTIPAFGIMG